MQKPVKERIAKLRDEIAQISEANRLYMQGSKKLPGAVGGPHRLEKTLKMHRPQNLPDMGIYECRGGRTLREESGELKSSES
jgi:hypothetical protein